MVAVENRFLRALKKLHHPSEPVSETNKEKDFAQCEFKKFNHIIVHVALYTVYQRSCFGENHMLIENQFSERREHTLFNLNTVPTVRYSYTTVIRPYCTDQKSWNPHQMVRVKMCQPFSSLATQ